MKTNVARIPRRWIIPLIVGSILFLVLLLPAEWTNYPQTPSPPHETCRSQLEIGETGEYLCPSDSRLLLITPTYERLTRRPDLIKMKNTLGHLSDVLWILIEDGKSIDPYTEEWLREDPVVPFVYLAAETHVQFNRTHRGLDQRNAALDYIRDRKLHGVIYFADDDNAYDLGLFKALRGVRRLSLFDVGGIGRSGVEGPALDKDGAFARWVTSYAPGRRYPVDMAAFAFPSTYLFKNPDIRFKWETHGGQMETAFLTTVEKDPKNIDFIQELIDHVRVFHVKTKPIRTSYPKDWASLRQKQEDAGEGEQIGADAPVVDPVPVGYAQVVNPDQAKKS